MYLVICVQMRRKSNYFIKLVFPFLWQFSSNWPQLSPIQHQQHHKNESTPCNILDQTNRCMASKFGISRKIVQTRYRLCGWLKLYMYVCKAQIPNVYLKLNQRKSEWITNWCETILRLSLAVSIQHYGTYEFVDLFQISEELARLESISMHSWLFS